VAELQTAKWAKLREVTTIIPNGYTCGNAGSHFAADGDRSRQHSNVRNFALEKILATAIYLCPFAETEGFP
jgi:hypothetical protein